MDAVPADLAYPVDMNERMDATVLTQVTNMLEGCESARARAELILELLIKQSHCAGGFLYTMQKQGPALYAQVGDEAPSAEIETMVRDRIADETEDKDDITQDGEEGE